MLRKSIYLILFIALTGCASYKPFPETETQQDGANTIHVYMGEMDYDKAFRFLSQKMIEHGFSVEYSDKDLGVINSTSKEVDGNALAIYKITCSISDADNPTLLIKGKYDSQVGKGSSIENIGMDGSPAQLVWQDMNRFAQSFNARRITYSRQ